MGITDFSALPEAQRSIVAQFTQKFKSLDLAAVPVNVELGPVVTAYYFKPHHSIPLAKVLNKSEDFALAAGVDKVNIQRIRGDVVIFAANNDRKFVDYKEYLNWYLTDEKTLAQRIPIPLGIDHIGVKQSVDLTELPHILLAGSTGSGKSVFESAIIASLGVRFTREEVELILVDTKQLDLPLFSRMPNVVEVCTELMEYIRMMEALISEARQRMQTLQGATCRNIQEYHAMGYKMPYKVLIIDEFADLLEQDREAKREKYSDASECAKVDDQLKRLVQIARAVGIHIIAGTQRTSVKVVSGDIKANFPCRVSLKLPTGFDSVTILGEYGAETLLGKGDMLISMPASEVLQRYHGPFVKASDISWIITELDYIRDMYKTIRAQTRKEGAA
jgi:S-DNA-T family DNA segregation ATPase FtsK/SpoIIIE